MPIKPYFRPQDSVLVLIDHQIGTMQLVKTLDVERVSRLTLALARAARILDIPVVLTSSQEDHIQGPLLARFKEIVPDAYEARVKRSGIVNAWSDPAFVAAIERTGRRQIAMGGVTTDVCLVFPAIDAARAGYQVQAVLDISGSPFSISEETARTRMANAGVEFTCTNTLISEWAQDWSTPEGQQLIQLMFMEILPSITPALEPA